MEKTRLFPTENGTPQGGPASPTLANLVLDGLEDLLGRKYGSAKLDGHYRKSSIAGIHFVRYADDFVVTGKSKEILEDEVKPLIEAFLKERGLELSPDKTIVTHISEGFNFLGQNIRKYHFGKSNSKLLIKPSDKNIKTFLTTVRETIKSMRTAKQENLIRKLNLKIRGWANFHRSVVSKKIFSKVDAEIWFALWRWAVRRHPKKNKNWIYTKYFRTIKERKHCFSCTVKDEETETTLTLMHAADLSIKRHVKIVSEATPFDPAFDGYFEDRISSKMGNNKEGRRKVNYLWKRQMGICPACGENITKVTDWRVHYLESRLDGGTGNLSNLVLLHPQCKDGGYNSDFKLVFPDGEDKIPA
jgi:RNA-directed DNA polymerase